MSEPGPSASGPDRVQVGDGLPRTAGPIDLNRYEAEPPWLGIPTYMKLPFCRTPEDLRAGEVDVAIGGAPWDGTNMNRSGGQWGPRAIRAIDHSPLPHDRTHQHVRVDPFQHLRVCDYGDAEVIVGDTEATFRNIRSFVSEMCKSGVVPITLGGDHGISWPCIGAVAEHLGERELTVVHLDAHADTAPEFQGNPYSHACPMRRAIEEGAIGRGRLIQAGLRGYFPPDDVLAWMDEQEIRCHFMAEVEEDGIDLVLDRVIAEAADLGGPVYLSLDIDVTDPAYAPGTGSAEPGGFTSRELLRSVRRIAAELEIVAMDLVEVNPTCDAGNGITARLAHYAVMEALTGIAMRRLGITDSGYLHPRALGGARQG